MWHGGLGQLLNKKKGWSQKARELEDRWHWLNTLVQTSSQDGGTGRYTASSHNQKDNKFKNKKQPELTENQTVWKSDNQGVKEETFIQTSRRGGDGQPSGEDSQQGGGWWNRWLVEPAVPHLHTDKPGGTTGKRERPPNPGFQCREIKPQNHWLKKSVGVEATGETPSLTEEFIGETHRILECIQTHPPGISTRRAQFACG